MYRVEIPRAVEKDIKKISSEAQAQLDKHLENLSKNPFRAKLLRGPYRKLKLRKWEFKVGRTEYRIVFRILKEEKVLLLSMVGSREGFYQRLKERIL